MFGHRRRTVTEAEWLSADDIWPMKNYLWETGKYSSRKYRLAGCGIYRLIRSGTFSDQESRLLDLAEAFADDPSFAVQVRAYADKADEIPGTFPFEVCWPPDHGRYGSETVARVVSFMQDRLADQWWELHPTQDDDEDEAQTEAGRCYRRQANAVGATILREVLGNPFHPVDLDPEWRTQKVLAFARQMYESREFCTMPILADALQDAGCDSDDILDHCRGPGPHVRGCWVVDLVLGKE
ncbi:hypothetical protein [Gemmata obscuriglobus]|nr:hypothetical protein [Gemmata obscuriglobus]